MSAALPPCRSISIGIHRPAEAVYAFAPRPEAFAQWPAGLGAGLTRDGETWIAQGPDSDVRVRVSPKKDLGVRDHGGAPADGTEIRIPLRVMANGDGAEVTLTLFRLPGRVTMDLSALKARLEA